MLAPLAALLLLEKAQEPPVQVFVLAGQSNMVGHGFVAADPGRNGGKGSLEEAARSGRLRHLLDKDGRWRVRDDVRIQFFERKGPLTVGYGAGEDCIGPELGFGDVVGDALAEPVLLVKIAWGGKSLAVDFRPPGAGGEVGPCYTELVRQARSALARVGEEFPEWAGRSAKLAGFGWHQGWNDRINGQFVQEYGRNMAHFIRDLRRDLQAPLLPFVIAETGMGGFGETDAKALALMEAQAAVPQSPEFRSSVAFVGTRAAWRPAELSPSGQGYHWNSNGETYYLIGEGMGRAMVGLLRGRPR
jgi:alpha-galactosidase